MNEYDLGDKIRVSVNIQVDDADTDPTALTFSERLPTGVFSDDLVYSVDAELVKDSAGDYHVDLTPAASGIYYYKWAATGTAHGAAEGNFLIKQSKFPT